MTSGKIAGKKEFLTNSLWNENIFCSQKGYLLQLEKDKFYDIAQSCPTAGLIIYQYLIKSECQTMKNKIKIKTLKIDEKNEKIKNFHNSDEFIEIDVEKTNNNSIENAKEKENSSIDKISFNYAPLFIHEIFAMEQKISKKKEIDKVSAPKTKKKQSHYSSTFLNEKMEKQIMEENKLKFERRSNKSPKKFNSNSFSASKINKSFLSNNNEVKKKYFVFYFFF